MLQGTALDYLVHPMEVLEILSSMHADINLRIAGVLHDTLEDTKLSAIQIREQFGDDVADLVVEHTENKERSWKERKQEHIRKLYHGSTRHRMLVLADSLSNRVVWRQIIKWRGTIFGSDFVHQRMNRIGIITECGAVWLNLSRCQRRRGHIWK